jgi:antitoxin MazE
METKIQQWGNSLAVRIPRAYAAHARVKKGARVEIVAQDGRLTITPLTPSAPRLDVLLKRISRKNLHAAAATGPAAGNEGWA